MEKIKLSDVIVVEGKYDKIKLSSFVDAVILTTGGFGVFNSREKSALIKKLSEKKREKLYPVILENAVAVGIGEASPAEQDQKHYR